MSDDIQIKTFGMNELTRASAVAAYHPIGSEVKTTNILNGVLKMNKKLGLPKIIKDSLVFAQVKDLANDLEIGKYNIMTPKDHCKQLAELDLVFVPGILWDENGYRIGYGGGYYDRFLPNIDTLSMGLAYEFQVFENIPHGKTDFRVDMIVTDKRIIMTK